MCIMDRLSLVVKKVAATNDITHDSRSTEINMTTNMIPPVVAKKDTASQHIECGTIYSRFKAMTNLMPPSIVKKKKTARHNIESEDTVEIVHHNHKINPLKHTFLINSHLT